MDYIPVWAYNLAAEFGKTREQAKKDWNEANQPQPNWCQIIKNYGCERF